MKKLFILLACVSVLFSCGDKDNNNGKDTPYVDKPQNGIYNEPLVNFGASKAEIKKQEKRTFLGEADSQLMFMGNNYMIAYLFENEKLTGSMALLPLTTDMKKLKSFLSSRYTYVGENDGFSFWGVKGKELAVGVGVDDTGIGVVYMPIRFDFEKTAPLRYEEPTVIEVMEKIKTAIRQQMQ